MRRLLVTGVVALELGGGVAAVAESGTNGQDSRECRPENGGLTVGEVGCLC
jgi:hypothetical protein